MAYTAEVVDLTPGQVSACWDQLLERQAVDI